MFSIPGLTVMDYLSVNRPQATVYRFRCLFIRFLFIHSSGLLNATPWLHTAPSHSPCSLDFSQYTKSRTFSIESFLILHREFCFCGEWWTKYKSNESCLKASLEAPRWMSDLSYCVLFRHCHGIQHVCEKKTFSSHCCVFGPSRGWTDLLLLLEGFNNGKYYLIDSK